MIIGGRALFGRGPLGLPNSDKLRMPINLRGQNMGEWVRVRRATEPPAKVPKYMLSGKDVALPRQLGCWLRSSHHLKECVIAHWSSDTAPKCTGAKHITEAVDCRMDNGRRKRSKGVEA